MPTDDRVPTMWQRWRALPAGERRRVKRQVQDGGPVDGAHARVAAWYADVRSGLLVLLAGIAFAALVGALVVATSVSSAIAWVVVVVVGLSVYVDVAELVRVRHVRRELTGSTIGH